MKMKSDLIESVQPMFYFYYGLDKYGRGDFVALELWYWTWQMPQKLNFRTQTVKI